MYRWFLLILLLLCCLGFGTCVCLLLLDPNKSAVKALQVDTPRIDIESIRQQETKVVVYRLKNVADNDISLESVHASCGCTEWKLDKRQLKSGEYAELSVTFSSGQARNRIGSTIRVFYKNSKTSVVDNLFLELVANVQPDYTIAPQFLDFGKNDEQIQYVTLVPNFPEDIRILEISCTRRYFTVEIVKSNPDKSVVKVSFLKEKKLPGEKDAVLELHTSSLRQPVYQVGLHCEP